MTIDFDKITELYQQFPQQFQSIMLSTVTGEGMPHASYAPFVMDPERNIYIYVSGLSAHTTNLKTTGRASVLFIEDEVKTAQIFARRRLTYDCQAQVLAGDSGTWHYVADQFESRFGEMIRILKGLTDFQIFQLRPQGGRFVIGFGAAYMVDSEDLMKLVPVVR
jgi:putative heme iron utilization protein